MVPFINQTDIFLVCSELDALVDNGESPHLFAYLADLQHGMEDHFIMDLRNCLEFA